MHDLIDPTSNVSNKYVPFFVVMYSFRYSFFMCYCCLYFYKLL